MPLCQSTFYGGFKPILVAPCAATRRPASAPRRTLVVVANDKPSYAVTGTLHSQNFLRMHHLGRPPLGATGFVGSRLVSRLASQGNTVHVLTRNVQRAKFVLPYPNVQFFDARDWAAGIEGTTGVVNLAGMCGVGG